MKLHGAHKVTVTAKLAKKRGGMKTVKEKEEEKETSKRPKKSRNQKRQMRIAQGIRQSWVEDEVSL